MARDPSDYLLLLELLNARYAVSRYFDDALAETSLTTTDFGLYTMIAVAGPTTPQTLSHWTGMPPTTMSAKIRRLLAAGHGAKRPSDVDRRSYTLTLSKAGREVHANALRLFMDAFERLAARLPQSIPDVRESLQSLATSAREAHGTSDDRQDRTTAVDTSRAFASTVESAGEGEPHQDRGDRYRELFASRPRRQGVQK